MRAKADSSGLAVWGSCLLVSKWTHSLWASHERRGLKLPVCEEGWQPATLFCPSVQPTSHIHLTTFSFCFTRKSLALPIIAFTTMLGYCCCSVAESCPILCNLMDCYTPGFPVLYYLLEFAVFPIY